MVNQEFLRMALILGEGRDSSFKNNTLKIVKNILYINYGKKMTINEIVEEIYNLFSLEYLDSELQHLIDIDNSIVSIEDSYTSCKQYCLSPSERDKISQKDDADYFKRFITQFCIDNNIEGKKYDVQDLLIEFFYLSFNNDLSSMLNLLNKKDDKLREFIKISEKYTDEQRELINSFLDWDNKEKNECVFKIISSSYDYCLLTLKKNKDSYKDIFNKKIFYLDTNIIFRLLGVNSKERQKILELFINKCKEAKITIKYTSFTVGEIRDTINNYISNIKSFISGKPPLDPKCIKEANNQTAFNDFYDDYYKWTINNNYQNFEEYYDNIMMRVEKIYNKFTLEVSTSFEDSLKIEEFNEIFESFRNYKLQQYKTVTDNSIKVDVNNYMFLYRANSYKDGRTADVVSNYIITADRCFVEWARIRKPEAISTVVLPSVWYSILLKYFGRSNNDYEAYCQFLRLRLSGEINKDNDEIKNALEKVIQLDDTSDVRERVFYKVNKILLENKDETLNIEEIVNSTHNDVTKEIVDMKLSEQKEKLLNDFNKEKAEHLKKEENLVRKASENGAMEGEDSILSSIVNKKTQEIVKRRKILLKVIKYINIVILIMCTILLIWKIVEGAEMVKNVGPFSGGIAALIIFLVTKFSLPYKKFVEKITNEKLVAEKELNKLKAQLKE